MKSGECRTCGNEFYPLKKPFVCGNCNTNGAIQGEPIMDLGQYNQELRELEKAGIIEVEKTRDGREINFTEPGEALAEMQIAWDQESQLFLFDLYWTEKYDDMDEPLRKLIQIAEDMKEDPGINILRTIESNQDKLHGIEIKDGYLPEDLVKQFDPEKDSSNETGQDGGDTR